MDTNLCLKILDIMSCVWFNTGIADTDYDDMMFKVLVNG